MGKLLSLIVLIGLLNLSACKNEPDAATAELRVRPVKYLKVGNSKQAGAHYFTGLAKAQKEAKLSFKVGGTIDKINVKVGDRVKKGQVLANLDAIDYQVSYDQSQANVSNSKAQIETMLSQLESARANYVSSKSNYGRFEKLYETNSISLSDFEQSKSAYNSAEASLKAAEAQVTAAKAAAASSESMARSASNQVGYTRILAPFTGVISSVIAEPNEMVGQGNAIITINSESNAEVEIGVPENVISQIKANQKVKIQFNSIHDVFFDGVVHELGYSSAGSTYPVTVRLLKDDQRIRPGMPASAEFEFLDHHSDSEAILVPPTAVGEDAKGNFVFLIDSQNDESIVSKTYIEVGEINDSGFEIIKGLAAGQLVASAGLNVLRDGMKVSLYHNK